MSFTWAAKDPDEEYEYEHDWENRVLVNGVDVGDVMHQIDDPDPAKRPTLELTTGDVQVLAIVHVPGTNKIQYWLKGGTIKTKFEARIHTTQGRTYDESFVLPIKER